MKTIEVVAAILRDGGRIYATQRGYGDWKDYWEFPGGKIEPGETPEEALVREIREELGAKIAVDSYLTAVDWDYPAFHLHMRCYLCRVTDGELTIKEHEAARWLTKDELDSVAWLPADRTIIDLLKRTVLREAVPEHDGRKHTDRLTERITVTDDGVPLVGVLERPSAEPGPLVIVLHGFTSAKDRTHTLAACEAMREAGFATLRFDLYGHGESGGEFRKHTLHKWISNTLAVMDWAERQDFVTELWLSGHSQGGLTAALAAGKVPDRVRGLILRAPAFMIPRCAREGSMLGVSFDPARIPAQIATIKDLSLEGDYVRSAQAIRVEEAVDAFPGPVLLLHGAADDVVPLRDVEAAADRYRNCRLELIPGETHHFDRAPEQMKRLIRDWLTQQRAKE